ncbi:MAG: hypothetical protein M3N08_02990 [Pseudomonadota bacterium]|nr:hypothetical protein [Pseudomonadota bacterium]
MDLEGFEFLAVRDGFTTFAELTAFAAIAFGVGLPIFRDAFGLDFGTDFLSAGRATFFENFFAAVLVVVFVAVFAVVLALVFDLNLAALAFDFWIFLLAFAALLADFLEVLVLTLLAIGFPPGK